MACIFQVGMHVCMHRRGDVLGTWYVPRIYAYKYEIHMHLIWVCVAYVCAFLDAVTSHLRLVLLWNLPTTNSLTVLPPKYY